MIYLLFSILVLFTRVAFSRTAAQLCRGTAHRADDGNWYCSEVTAITYKNISQPGEYNRTTRVNPRTGLCDHEPVAYSGVGPSTPLIGELSMHLRGPMNVSQIAVYKLPDMSISKRDSTRRTRGRQNRRRRMQGPREEHGTIRSIWHSFWHHTHDDPNTEGYYTTEGANDPTSGSKAFTTQTVVATTTPKSAKTTLQSPGSTTKQSDTPTTVQTVFSTLKQTIATTIIQTATASNGQVGGPGMPQLTTNGPVCTITPTITTTMIVHDSTCPNPVPAITQTPILPPPPPPIVPIPVPIPFPAPAPPAPAPPVQPPPASAPPPPPPATAVPPASSGLPALPALSVLLAALSPPVLTTTATKIATTTFEVTESKCPKTSSSLVSQSDKLSSSLLGPGETACPCEESSALPPTPPPQPSPPPPPPPVPSPPPPAVPPPPPSAPASTPPSPPALPALPALPAPPAPLAPPALSSPCADSDTIASKPSPPPPVKRDELSPAVTGATQSAHPSSGPSHDNDIKVAAASTWSRVAYYTSAAPAAASGFAFLANLGDPQKSGTFDYAFGNSLGYVIGDGSKVAVDSTPFDGTLETSEREIAVFTDKVCDGNCEYARPDATAHYGWDGPSKAFFIEFQMDHYDNYGSDQGMLSDAPAWWFLNAAIPRVLQYGNDRKNIPCSCWSTGCGEFDAFEILGRGEMRAKSTIHRPGNLEGGDSNYFLRPVGRTIKFAVVFHHWNITARVLDDGFDFGASLTQAQIDAILAYDASDYSHSLFSVGD
ncbi:hypothetical protein P171DRAFT_523321 [Karstenula rhodostoma CBS 690.94]|uniref:glucan endo-1,3-beta-D-glucosidase n=1 Tax=Karstenula rhodostoma CBS 690.94 TaxID=1392251 RepID=A0A9P4U9Z4_9PLEO|nr:hypothetical protein P171DRAFT_523321 [Karstenula rhodostoma CBS 690.94]